MNYNTNNIEEQIVLLREKGLTIKEVSNKLSISYYKVRHILRNNGMKNFRYSKTCIECKACYESTKNHSTFCSSACRGKHFIKNNKETAVCEWCGIEFVADYGGRKFCSDNCKAEHFKLIYTNHEKREELEELNKKREVVKLLKAIEKTISRIRNCEVCEKEFILNYNGNKVKYCRECINDNKHIKIISRDERWRRNGKPDYSISLEKLFEREKGICYLCDGTVDYKDYILNKEGHFIAGDMYPSIDHVLPISKGGTHSWDNVKLAHRLCNSLKSDKDYREIIDLYS